MVRFRLPRVIALAFLLITLLVPVGAAAAKTTDAFGTGLGAKRPTFEARYGKPKSEKGADDFATGTQYAIPGYKSVYVFWHNDTAARIVLNAANGWTGAKASAIVERWIPSDATSTGAGAGANTDGYSWTTTLGHSDALAKRFSANTYQRYEVDGKQGDFRVALVKRPGSTGAFSTIDIAIGTDVTLPTSATTATASPSGTTSAKGDGSRYLVSMRKHLNDLGDSMDSFLAIMKKTTIAESDISQLVDITIGWQNADLAARRESTPAGYEKYHALYAQLTRDLNDCASNLQTFMTTKGADDAAFSTMATDFDNAAKAYNTLNDALTTAGH